MLSDFSRFEFWKVIGLSLDERAQFEERISKLENLVDSLVKKLEESTSDQVCLPSNELEFFFPIHHIFFFTLLASE